MGLPLTESAVVADAAVDGDCGAVDFTNAPPPVVFGAGLAAALPAVSRGFDDVAESFDSKIVFRFVLVTGASRTILRSWIKTCFCSDF